MSAPYVDRIEHVECDAAHIDAALADYSASVRGWRLTHVVPPLEGQSTVTKWHLFFQRETEDV